MLRAPKSPLLAALVAMSMGACGGKAVSRLASENLVVFPSPPDTARIQFLARYSGTADFGQNRRSLLQTLAGETKDDGDDIIIKPYGVAVGRGKVFTCDTQLRAVQIADFAARRLDFMTLLEDGGFRSPVNCSVDKKTGRLYVADAGRQEVVVFDTTYQFAGILSQENMRPVDVFAADGIIWVADANGKRVLAFDAEAGNIVRVIPDMGVAPEATLRFPTNIYVMQDKLYVSDFGSMTVKVFSTDGEFLHTVGQYGDAPGMFARPKGVAVDSTGVLYVVDAAFENVQMFNDAGELLMWFGGPYNGPGDMWLPAKVTIDYELVPLFEEFVHPSFRLEYLIFVTNQYGPDKVNVYGFVSPRSTRNDADTGG